MKKKSTFFSVLLTKVLTKWKAKGFILIIVLPIFALMNIVYIFSEHRDVSPGTFILLDFIVIITTWVTLKDKVRMPQKT